MFRLDTGQARTDLYGIGKGAAQVIDLGITERRQQQEASQNFAAQQKKLDEENAREADIQAQIAKMGAMKIMPKDQKLIAEKAKAVRDYVVQNNGMKGASLDKMMEFQRIYGDLQMSANQSEAFRQEMDKRGMKILENPDAYYPENIKQFMSKYSEETAGDWNLDDTLLRPRYDSEKRISDIAKETKDWADRNQREYSEVFTPEQAKQRLKDEIATNEAFAFDMVHKFNNADDKMGATTAAEYAEKLYLNRLPVNIRKAVPQGDGGSGSSTKRPLVSVVVTNVKGGGRVAEFNFTDKGENPPLKIDNPDVKGETIDLIPMAIIEKPDGRIVLKGTTKASGEGANRVEGKIKEIDYNSVASVMNNTFGIENPLELLSGKAPAHVSIKKYDLDIKKDKQATGGMIKINNKDYPVSKETKGYQLSKDGKKAKVTYSDGTTEVISL